MWLKLVGVDLGRIEPLQIFVFFFLVVIIVYLLFLVFDVFIIFLVFIFSKFLLRNVITRFFLIRKVVKFALNLIQPPLRFFQFLLSPKGENSFFNYMTKIDVHLHALYSM